MIRGLLSRTREVSIGEKGLNRVISVDTEGEEVKVKDLLATRNKSSDKPSTHNAQPKPVSELNELEKERVVTAYLNSIPKGRAIAVSGYGSFTPDRLKNELRKHTVVAEEIIDAVLRHSRYIEQAINDGRVRLLSNHPNKRESNANHIRAHRAREKG